MTQYRTFFVPLHDEGEAQDQLNAFLRSHRVLQVARNALPDGWAFCIEWLDGETSARAERFGRGGGGGGGGAVGGASVDYMAKLEPEQFLRYARMRDARRDLAQGDGVPPYTVLTNAQMAELAQLEHPSLADMKKIRGVGEKTVKKYGEALLAAHAGEGAEETKKDGADGIVVKKREGTGEIMVEGDLFEDAKGAKAVKGAGAELAEGNSA